MTVLELPQPYSFELSTERFRAFGTDLANRWHDGGLHRVVGGAELRLAPAPGGVRLEPWPAPADGSAAAASAGARDEVAVLLGASFDLAAFGEFAAGDPVLAPLARRLAGFRPPLAPDPWEMLVGSITAQQVSLHAAFAVRNRLVERFGRRHGLAWAFPTRGRVAQAREEELVALGFSRRKAEYAVALARAGLDLHALAGLPDDEVRARIVAQRGLGAWTADWFLARHLARPHAWPAGDLGLRKAVAAFYGQVGDVRAFGARFHPFQNLAAHYLLLGLRIP